jgi:hypothetical protein
MVVLKSPLLLPIDVWSRSPEAVPRCSCVCRAKGFPFYAVVCSGSKRVQEALCMQEIIRTDTVRSGVDAV